MRRLITVLTVVSAMLLSGLVPAAAQTGEAAYDIVVVGGERAVNPAVLAELETLTTGTVARISGPNRYATAAAISKVAHDPGVPVVYVATGQAPADALVAGPVAAHDRGPILLVERDRVPDETRRELERVDPGEVVVLGGSLAVSDEVAAELGAITGVPVRRLAGPSRYDTAAEVSRSQFDPGVPVAFIATGMAWPDALTVGPVASVQGGPILLATPNGLPEVTRRELERLGPRRIVALGGTAALAPAVLDDLEAYTSGPVERIGGPGREATAALVSAYGFPDGARIVFIATGADYPDALAVGALAGSSPAAAFAADSTVAGMTPGPVLLTRPGSLPEETRAELERLAGATPVPVADDQSVDTDYRTPVDITLTGGPAAAALTFDVTSGPQHGTLSGDAPDVTYTPDALFHGTDSFTFVTRLGALSSEPATVTITVAEPDPPVAHDQTVATPFETPTAITLAATAPSGEPLTYAYTQPANGTVTGTGPNVTYTPDAGFDGSDAFTFTAHDGVNTSAPATVTVLVEPDPPVASDLPDEETDQDTPVVITLDATSPSGQPLTYAYTQPANGTVTGDGPDVTYTPDPGFHGTDTFDYHVNDGFNDSNTATVTVTVHPAHPVAHDQELTVPKNAVDFAITLGADNPSGGPLTFEVVDDPTDGSATIVGDGPEATYTPDTDFEGTDTFTFRVDDTHNLSNIATVTLNVEPAAPVAHDDTAETDQDTPVVVTLVADNDSSNPLTYHYTQPDDGTVTGAGPDVTYTPDPGFHGPDSFTFHVNDGFNDSNTATISITVDPAHPIAHDVSADTAFETAVVITLDAESPSGGPLTYEIVDQPDDGTAVLVGDGPDVTYTPDPGFGDDDDTFTYRVNDTFNDSNVATVTVSVEPQPPEAHDMPDEETDQDTPVVITLDATNHSSNPLTYHYAQPDNGTVTGAGPDVTYTPDPGFFGTDSFTFHVNDGVNDSNTATVTVTVNFAAEDYDFDAVGNTLLEVGVAASGDPAVRVDATLLDDAPPGFEVVAVDTTGSSGEVDWNADGSFTYRPAAGFTGDDPFVYTIGDGTISGSGTVTVTVADLVWYVDGEASGDGRSWAPFATLAEAETASGTGDTVFVYEADAAYTDGIALDDDQTLLGEAAGLTVGGHDLVEAGGRPEIDASSGAAIGLAAGVEVEGLDVTGAAAQGLLADGISGTVTVADVDVSGTSGHGVRLTGTGTVTLDDVDVSGSGGSAVSISAFNGTLDHTGTITHAAAPAVVSISDTGAAADVTLGPATSTASGIAVSGNAGEVAIASATIGSAGSRVSGQPALSVSASAGTVTVDSLTGFVTGAAAVSLASTGTVTVGGGSVDATGGPAIQASGAALAVTLASATSSGSPASGLSLATATGTVVIGGGSVSGATGNAIDVNGGSVSLTSATSVTNAAGHSVRVAGLNGGAVALSGAVTDTGSGVSLTNNTGSTVAFSGALAITTTGSTAFAATGGGTVTATAAGSTLDATGARGLHVASTAIGAAGLLFEEISASGALHGIEVSGAGTGPLTVAGDGSADRNGAGGTITGMSSHGVTVSSAGPVTLRNMNVEGNDAVGIRAQAVTGLTVIAAHVDDNTDDPNDPATRNNVWLRNVTGQVRFEDSFVRGSEHNQIDVENTAGTVTITVARTEVRENGINSGLQVEAMGTSTVTLNVADSTFAATHATGVHAFARNTADLTVTIDGNTFTDNNVAVNLAAQHTATIRSTVTDNVASGHASHSINATVHDDAEHDTTITGNEIDGSDTVASVGIRLVAENDALMRAVVEDNEVTGQTSGHGFRLLAREDAGQVHLVLRDNHVVTTSMSPAYSLEPLTESYLCAAISGNTGSSNHPSRDLFVDLFDSGARGDIEGLAVGQRTQAEFEAHLSAQNPGPRVGTFVATPSNVFGVAADTCERPSS